MKKEEFPLLIIYPTTGNVSIQLHLFINLSIFLMISRLLSMIIRFTVLPFVALTPPALPHTLHFSRICSFSGLW